MDCVHPAPTMSRNLPFLESLKLKTVISLTPEPLTDNIRQWAGTYGIRLLHIRPEKEAKKSAPLQSNQARDILAVILDREQSPLYIHCLNGSETTSLAICALRKLQFWTHPTIFSEMLRFSDIRTSSEIFLDRLGIRDNGIIVRIPKAPVPWLWQGLLDEEGLLPVSIMSRIEAPGMMIMIAYDDEDLGSKRKVRFDTVEQGGNSRSMNKIERLIGKATSSANNTNTAPPHTTPTSPNAPTPP
ncbi:MAG: hypothetical protein M1827_007480 [Pycnora praestabilis]|nr:MAG: hypothetical protein M1827_007480 [Pycnora praestabilis]